MHRHLLVGGLALVTLLSLAPTGLGAWSVPAAEPYEADKRVIVNESADRRDLTYGDGLLAWVQRAANNTTGDPEPGAVPRIAILSVAADGGRSGNVTVPSEHPADGPSVSEGYVAWRAHPGGHDRMGDDAEIRVLERETGEVRTLDPVQARTAEPVLDREDVYWLTYNLRDPNRTIHRMNLTTGEHARWTPPADCNTRSLGIVGDALLLSCGYSLAAWVPGENRTTPVTSDEIMYATGTDHVVTVEYRDDDGGRGASLYLHNVSSGDERRLTFSEGRETDPSMSGSLVAWADTRNDDGRRDPWYDVYFQDVRTRNEYKIEGARDITAMPVLAGDRVYYGDNEGRLIEAELPSEEERLVSDANSTIREGEDRARWLNVTLNGSGEHTVAWDTDGDGTFETEGNLTVEISGRNRTPNDTVQGVAVEADGRYVVVTVDTGTAYQMASSVANGTTGANQTAAAGGENASRSDPGDADSREPTEKDDEEDPTAPGPDGPSPPGDRVDTAPLETSEPGNHSNTTDRRPGSKEEGSDQASDRNPTPGPEIGTLFAVATGAILAARRRS